MKPSQCCENKLMKTAPSNAQTDADKKGNMSLREAWTPYLLKGLSRRHVTSHRKNQGSGGLCNGNAGVFFSAWAEEMCVYMCRVSRLLLRNLN